MELVEEKEIVGNCKKTIELIMENHYRKGIKDGNNLELTHGLNGIRNTAKNIIQDQIDDDGRKDYKIDCIAAEFKDWEVSW